MNVFVDANVFFAAARSPHGGSGFVLRMARAGSITVITTEHVLREAERNIRQSFRERELFAHYQNILQGNYIIQHPFEFVSSEASIAARYVPGKDVPILVGAVLARADVLLTLDRRHFSRNEALLKLQLPIEIMEPSDFLKKYF
ncbi:hypothetical protein BK004_02140 [bacterium CG10_46_32]|nr:MAG: hypothetical protein BK004_02140 [bacterium CG10_46_32]PIR56230.1 MAG: hypothetical protein COU73_02165 [Parcubacteria group bacterium CG10_big_fil_rev_8_21_14_0_10_46_32]